MHSEEKPVKYIFRTTLHHILYTLYTIIVSYYYWFFSYLFTLVYRYMPTWNVLALLFQVNCFFVAAFSHFIYCFFALGKKSIFYFLRMLYWILWPPDYPIYVCPHLIICLKSSVNQIGSWVFGFLLVVYMPFFVICCNLYFKLLCDVEFFSYMLWWHNLYKIVVMNVSWIYNNLLLSITSLNINGLHCQISGA